jgi:hypothetical protein
MINKIKGHLMKSYGPCSHAKILKPIDNAKKFTLYFLVVEILTSKETKK